MRLVIQRVSSASVRVDGELVGAIGPGLLVLVGVREGDDEAVARRLATKTAELRIFADGEGRFNRSVLDPSTSSGQAPSTGLGQAPGEVLVVSQFTLYGDVRKGRRPSFNDAAGAEVAELVVEAYASALEGVGLRVARGRFGAHMMVESVNDGPVTILIDSAELEKPRRG